MASCDVELSTTSVRDAVSDKGLLREMTVASSLSQCRTRVSLSHRFAHKMREAVGVQRWKGRSQE